MARVGIRAMVVLVVCFASAASVSAAEQLKAQLCQQHSKSPDTCKKVEQCAWCISKIPGVKPGCFKAKRALFLPKRLYQCSKDASQLLANVCEGKTEAQCTKPECVWCKSAAVPSSCYTPDEAKRLPHAIFQCDANFGLGRLKRQNHKKRQDSNAVKKTNPTDLA